eukprot:SAG11_NODE_18886_length_479_cov_0.836842_1_plen_25_part_01
MSHATLCDIFKYKAAPPVAYREVPY